MMKANDGLLARFDNKRLGMMPKPDIKLMSWLLLIILRKCEAAKPFASMVARAPGFQLILPNDNINLEMGDETVLN